jgi:hypothetical protein
MHNYSARNDAGETKSRKIRWGTFSMNGEMKNTNKISVIKPERKRLLWRPPCR